MMSFEASRIATVLGCICCVGALQHCANPVSPSGGPRDTTPPVLILEESTPNLQTNFEKQVIRLTYDEWIVLKDAPSQVVISPPLERNPEITLKGKTVIYGFHDDEILRDSTTYTINFGQAIQDLTESNPVQNFLFVFSTGDFIDSLSLSGTVYNAATGDPEPDIYVILHLNQSDTAMSTLRPAYFAQTDKDGAFTMNYLREDTFRIYALKDHNLNYRYDQPGEMFGFHSKPIFLTADTVHEVRIEAYIADPSLIVTHVGQSGGGGVVKIALTRADDRVEINTVKGELPGHWLIDLDTLRVWHQHQDTTQIEIAGPYGVIDTVSLRPFVQNTTPVQMRLIKGMSFHPDDPVRIIVKTPISRLEQELVKVMLNDSIEVTECVASIDSADQRILVMDCTWEEAGKYRITLLPGAVTDFFGNTNDTIDLKVTTHERINFGQIHLSISEIDSSFNYIVHLLDGQQIIRRSILPAGKTRHVIDYDKLGAKAYALRIIEDRNGNDRWDPGDFATLSQPERLLLQPIEPLRAGWDLDVTIKWPG